MLVTSISLPMESAELWRAHRHAIMVFAARYLRVTMRSPVVRGETRTYNRNNGRCVVITVRWTAAEYDTLHAAAAALRVSVSSLIFGLIRLWQKPSRHLSAFEVASNYAFREVCWQPYAGLTEEDVLFHVYPRDFGLKKRAKTTEISAAT